MSADHVQLQSCLIANRGEIAVRIIRACRELNIRAVAVYSEADVHARHVEMADAAYSIGAAPVWESYLKVERLLEAASATGCDCVHPGYGFLSESEAFAQAVIDAGLTWIGPSPAAIRAMGVKTEARALMEAAGVPLVPGFQSTDADDDAFLAAAGQIGFPVMVKAAGGGGGKGIRVVYDASALGEALSAARHEAEAAFGDPRIFLEKFIERGRHVEIQVLADAQGHTVHLFERECSAQRRHQKIIEETPSPLLDDATRAQMGAAAVAAAQAVGYVNAGTVEFIVTPDGEFYFLEMNTRLQVEHPITELVTGVDLVKLQFAIAAGEPLQFTQDVLRQRGHAIECRVYAEDPANGFLPATGRLLRFIPPTGPGVRVDSGVQSGDDIGIHYDPMIAKIIVHDRTREAAIRRMITALGETVILGVTTNLEFLRTLLEHPAFLAGEVDTSFVERHLDELLAERGALPDAALIAAALHEMTGGAASTRATAAVEAVSDPWSRADAFRIGASSE
ncbi:MAG: acetyl-CoA carboxylase biotin carboxylase subunit [Anaerolineae bacterium]|nr:acetyl-CoA carboxylase biotin carboxylase subunit [Anaerolineae bacterium]